MSRRKRRKRGGNPARYMRSIVKKNLDACVKRMMDEVNDAFGDDACPFEFVFCLQNAFSGVIDGMTEVLHEEMAKA